MTVVFLVHVCRKETDDASRPTSHLEADVRAFGRFGCGTD
jgi:hypothetical protein